MFTESHDQYIGKILQKLSAGKTLRGILLEMSWEQRAKLLQNLKVIRKCEMAFKDIINESS